jgi:hypothetical protein
MKHGFRWWFHSVVPGLMLVLGACVHGAPSSEVSTGIDAEINIVPVNYKADILGAMHAYLSDPTGIRDAGIAEPALKAVGNAKRYVVCLRFNAKKRGSEYAGVKEIAAVFMVGRFDRFEISHETSHETSRETSHEPSRDTSHEPCAGAAYTPFPELQKLSR